MKNLLNEKPNYVLRARLLESVTFVSDEDIKKKDVLDIGCGYGWCELNCLHRGVKKVVGIEITKEDLKTAKKYVKDKRARFEVGGALELPFKDNSFDTIVSWEVLEHIPKNTEDIMFLEVNRVLRKNGVFYLSTPYNHFLTNLLDPAWWLIGHRHYSKEQLTRYGKKGGFKIEKYYVKGKKWTLINLVNMYVAKWLFKRKPFFERFLNEKEDAEYKQKGGFAGNFIKYRKV